MRQIQQSELILNPDGSIYHLNLLPEDISDLIILVGDQDRVPVVSHFFDTIEVKNKIVNSEHIQGHTKNAEYL